MMCVQGFNEHQMAKLKKSEAFTVEREKEIQQVVESVNELAQIMKDLSVLVIDQVSSILFYKFPAYKTQTQTDCAVFGMH